MKITRTSPFSGKEHTLEVPVTEAQMIRYENREDLIQNIFPNLDRGLREFIKTGITPDEWEETFN